ncbi:ATP-binding protein [candidate division NPL-UPA2 bacterium]|nr:ATP-binding protein [candidate division NPL-UPA2 bacterium]
MRISIGRKILISFTPILILMIVMGVGNYHSFTEPKEAGDELEKEFLQMDKMHCLRRFLLEALLINDYFISGVLEKKGDFSTSSVKAENAIRQLEEFPQLDEEERIYVDRVKKNFTLVKAKSNEILKFADFTKKKFISPQANKLAGEIKAISLILVEDMEKLNEHTMHEVSEIIEDMEAAKIAATYSLIIITLLSVLLSTAIGFTLTHTITKPVRALTNSVKLVAKGDLTQIVKFSSRDEIGDLATSFSKMTEELKQTHAQLIQSGKLVAIGELGAGIAHELNNPVAGILGYAQYLLEKVNEPDFQAEGFKEYEKCLGYIEKEAERCKAITGNLLKFSRCYPGEFELLNINQVIEDTLALIGYQLMIKKIKLEKEFTSDLKPVEGNANQLQQVFTNIILNAQQAMSEGGELSIITKKRGDQIEIQLSDTGYGIPARNLDRIFDPFFTTKMDWKGTGLGLSVSYKIIQNHKGQVEVKSEVGKGATFTITLPAKE